MLCYQLFDILHQHNNPESCKAIIKSQDAHFEKELHKLCAGHVMRVKCQ